MTLELAVRRLSWWQQAFANPQRNMQFLVALLDRLTSEPPMLLLTGYLRDKASPWAKQVGADLLLVGLHPDSSVYWRAEPLNFSALLTDAALQHELKRFDPLWLLAQAFAQTVAPPELAVAGVTLVAVDEPMPSPTPFVCGGPAPDGSRCEAAFASWRALRAHRRFHHRHRSFV